MNLKVKNIIFCIILLLAVVFASAQPHSLPYNQTKPIHFNNGQNSVSSYLIQNQIITYKNLAYESVKMGEFSLTKYNRKKGKEWQKSVFLPYYSINLIDLKEDDYANIYVLGSVCENDNNLGFYLIKLNKKGKVLWSKTMRYSDEFSGINNTTSIYLKTEGVVLLNKAQSIENDSISQINFFCFDKKGNTKYEVAAEINNNVIGSSIDSNGFIYILCGKMEGNKARIESIVSLADVIENLRNVNTQKFQIEKCGFVEATGIIDTLHFNEINLFNETMSKQANMNIRYFALPETSFVKIKTNILSNNELDGKFFLSLAAANDASVNLWSDKKLVNLQEEEDDDKLVFSFYMKKIKDFDDLKFKTQTDLEQKIKSNFTIIGSVNSGIYDIIQIKKYKLDDAEVIEF